MTDLNASKKQVRAPRQFTQEQRDRYVIVTEEIAKFKEVLKSLGQLYRSMGELFKEVEAQGLYELEGYRSFKEWLWTKYQISVDHAGKYKRIATRLTEADVQGRDLCLNGWVILARSQGRMKTLLLEMVDRHHPTAETLDRALRMGRTKADEGGSAQEVRKVLDAIGRMGSTTLPREEGKKEQPGVKADDLRKLVRKLFQGLQKLEGTAAVAEKRQKAGDEVANEDLEQLLKLGGDCFKAIVDLARERLGPEVINPLLREILGGTAQQSRAEADDTKVAAMEVAAADAAPTEDGFDDVSHDDERGSATDGPDVDAANGGDEAEAGDDEVYIYSKEEEAGDQGADVVPDLPELDPEQDLGLDDEPVMRQGSNRRKTVRDEARPARRTARQIALDEEYERQNAEFDELLKPRVYEEPDPDEPPPMALIEYQRQLQEAEARKEEDEREERRRRRQRRRRQIYEEGGFSEISIEVMLQQCWEEDGNP